jgi:outer membrane beta-barrel protein
MHKPVTAFLPLLLAVLPAVLALSPAHAATPQPANDQVIDPQLDRRDVRVPRIPSNDWEVGDFVGTYQMQNFGATFVGGLRLGYHVTEDVFVEAVYGQTHVSDSAFRQILPGGIFPKSEEMLQYYNLSAGYNVFPGEIFFGHGHAKISTMYVVAGLGNTRINNANHQTVNVGLGSRIFVRDWVAFQVDVRDYLYSLDLLGPRKETQNLELTAGVTFFF